MVHKDLMDELPAIALGLATLFQGRRGGHISADGVATLQKSFFVTLIEVVFKVWEEKGGSMKDESEMLESLFCDPDPAIKSHKLIPEEHKKVSAVIKAMTPAEQKVFRIALFLMNPEFVTIEVSEVKGKDDKAAKPATKRTEKTGVDPRVNVLRGIAGHVSDDLKNAGDVAEMLRDTGALGSNNPALHFLQKVQVELKKLLCTLLGITSIEHITMSLLYERLVGSVENQKPVPMGPIEYMINMVMMGKEHAELVLIPRWVKDIAKNLFSKSKPSRPPLEHHERIPPTL